MVLNVTKVTDGFGFGAGAISHAGISQEDSIAAEAVIVSNDILIPLSQCNGQELQDDGCGDGRPVTKVFKGTRECSTSLNRAKVFGGGATMATAILIGNSVGDQSLTELFHAAMQQLTQHHLAFGDHTDDQAADVGSGCGAVDKAPAILAAVNTYASQIKTSITALGTPTDGIDEVIAAFNSYQTMHAHEPYAGRAVIDDMLAQNKVVKQLAGDHKEKYIILNMVPHMTINQAAVRAATHNTVQVFGVDVWRLQQISQAFPEYGHKAFLATLVYTLATSAVLTAGDLPVYLVQAH
jgi:hypothetical protein